MTARERTEAALKALVLKLVGRNIPWLSVEEMELRAAISAEVAEAYERAAGMLDTRAETIKRERDELSSPYWCNGELLCRDIAAALRDTP